MNILISIVSWNYLFHLEKELPILLESIDSNDFIQVFETGKRVQSFSLDHPQLHIEISSENLGFAATHGKAVSTLLEKDFDGILILNPDVQIPTSLIKNLKQVIAETKNEAVLGAPIYNIVNEELQLEYGGYPLSEKTKNDLNSAIYDSESRIFTIHPMLISVTDLHGSLIYFPKTVIEKNGWMDTTYFLYGEENEYLHRLDKSHVSILMASKLAILHENGGTFSINNQLKNIREYYKTRNRLFNNIRLFGKKEYLKINYAFILKYWLGRNFLRIKRFKLDDANYYNFLGHIHFLKGIRGKTFDPNEYDC